MIRDEAERLDAADPLADFVEEFVVAEERLIYLDGNSLGRLPRRTAARVDAVLRHEWGAGLVRSWADWLDLPTRVGDRIGAALLGAGPGQVLVADSTTINLYKLAAAAVEARPGRTVIATDEANFPTDRYVLQGLAGARGMTIRLVGEAGALPAALDGDVALVASSLVDYRSGAVAPAAEITAAAHGAGALTLWDLSHAAGAVVVSLDEWDVDLAAGCSYKYLHGGPGAPAWLYVRQELQEGLVPPVWGWFGNEDQFAMGPGWHPAAGIRRWLSGTPDVLGLTAVEAGVSVLEEAGIDRMRSKAVALTSYGARLAERWLRPLGFTLGSPPDPAQRGSHIALRHHEAYRLSRALIEEAATIVDFRRPDVLRIGLAPLTTRFIDVWDGLDRLRDLAEARAWERYDRTPGRIT